MLKLKTSVLLLLLIMASVVPTNGQPATVYSIGQGASSSDSLVCFTLDEADSLVRAYDEIMLERDLLQVDLKACRSSLPAPEDAILRWAKNPVVWFLLGGITGAILAD